MEVIVKLFFFLLGSDVDVIVEENVQAVTAQDVFLTNGKNKTGLIRQLSRHLEEAGILSVQAKGDADRSIVLTAIDAAADGEKACIIGNDTDLAVLLAALTPDALMYDSRYAGKTRKSIAASNARNLWVVGRTVYSLYMWQLVATIHQASTKLARLSLLRS